MGKRNKYKRGRREYKAESSEVINNELVELDQNKVLVEPKTQGQREYIHEIINNTITLCEGPAGSGKTCVAIGLGLQNVLGRNNRYDKIIIMRPAKAACDEDIGFLPGDADEKLMPFIAPFIDNMLVYINQSKIEYLLKNKKIEVIPLAFCRGRSLNNAFIILDEAQNCSPKQLLMVLTRIGENSKLVINGDVTQNDLSDYNKTGLQDAIERLQGMKDVGIMRLDETDIVRNPMIGEIIRRYRS